MPNLVWRQLPIIASTEQELALAEAMMSAGFYQGNDLFKQFSQPWWTPQLRNLRNWLRKM